MQTERKKHNQILTQVTYKTANYHNMYILKRPTYLFNAVTKVNGIARLIFGNIYVTHWWF